MGLVESRWRPLWAALWIAVITYLISRTMNQLALRRARLRILDEAPEGRSLANAPSRHRASSRTRSGLLPLTV